MRECERGYVFFASEEEGKKSTFQINRSERSPYSKSSESFLFFFFKNRNMSVTMALKENETPWLGGQEQPQTLFNIRNKHFQFLENKLLPCRIVGTYQILLCWINSLNLILGFRSEPMPGLPSLGNLVFVQHLVESPNELTLSGLSMTQLNAEPEGHDKQCIRQLIHA